MNIFRAVPMDTMTRVYKVRESRSHIYPGVFKGFEIPDYWIYSLWCTEIKGIMFEFTDVLYTVLTATV